VVLKSDLDVQQRQTHLSAVEINDVSIIQLKLSKNKSTLLLKITFTKTQTVQLFTLMGSAISIGREPKSCLGRVFNSKLGRIATLGSKCMVSMQPLLKLKTRPRACPVS
jgi:hypothetical protein